MCIVQFCRQVKLGLARTKESQRFTQTIRYVHKGARPAHGPAVYCTLQVVQFNYLPLIVTLIAKTTANTGKDSLRC